MKTIISTLSCLLCSFTLYANTVVAISSNGSPGDWDKPATWSGGRVPQSGDVVLIPLHKGVTIKGTEYTTQPMLTIQVWGTINFEPSGKLNLSGNSSLQLYVGGTIVPKNGASSQLITMGGVTKYNATNDGTVTGPALANILTGASIAGQPMNGFGFGIALPVFIKNFSAQETNTGVVVRWETAGELNVDHFEIQRSENGTAAWLAVGTVAAKGAAALYSFNGSSLSNDKFFFRLKTVYTDGGEDYSSILTLEKNNTASLVISPNPVSDVVTICFPQKLSGKLTIGLLNLSGQVIKTLESDGVQNSFRLSLSGVPRGSYFLCVENKNKERVTKTLVVQ